jgi:hypothetical protein
MSADLLSCFVLKFLGMASTTTQSTTEKITQSTVEKITQSTIEKIKLSEISIPWCDEYVRMISGLK